MLKPKSLKKGDKVAIVSLSRGLLGEPFIKHELDLALERLKSFGLEPIVMPNALKGMAYLEEHPEARASDLKQAFMDESIKGIISAIGGYDTYKIIPYLLDDTEFIEAVKNNPKIFVGFSDTTINHLMFYKLGLQTFYGPSLLADIAELDKEMLPYTKLYFDKLFLNEESYEIKSSNVWYLDRESYGPEQLGVPRVSKSETHGYEVLNGNGIVQGKLYGGCLESIYEAITGCRYEDEKSIFEKYSIIPSLENLREHILFLETSDEKSAPEYVEKMLNTLKDMRILSSVKGIIVGKPIDEIYYEEYKEVYKRVFADLDTPVLYNVNFGHSVPRCLIPYGVEASVDFDNKKIVIEENIFDNN